MTDSWNVRIDVGGVTFVGPGMGSRAEAESVKSIVEESTGEEVEVFRPCQ